MLTLPIKLKWFDMIASGEKTEEYRDIKNYYCQRFAKYIGEPSFKIRFRAGYRADSPLMECDVFLSSGCGREDWGAPVGWIGFILKIQKVKILQR